jgi:glycosyltransferase involved in cell wall biosynthesis
MSNFPFSIFHFPFVMNISAVIITFNEEKNIAEAIKSVAFADEIVIVDSESTDKTREIAESLGAKVIVQKWLGFSKQKQFAVDSATHDQILSLDADERISDKLRDEILNLKTSKNLADGYKIPRLSIYMKREVRYSGWYPDWQVRFFNRTKGRWKNAVIHESFEIDGKIDKLKHDILHYSVENATYHHKMIGERYAPLAAKQMFERGKRTTAFKVATVGLTTFLQTYFVRLGFLDGFAGFCIARFAAHHAFMKYLLLWEMQGEKVKGKR